MALPSAADLLKTQLTQAWASAWSVLEDLSEDEYFWEPAVPSWSVRQRGPGVRGWGSGDWVCEDAWPPPDPLPTTTIAWRVIHLAAWTEVYLDFAFGDAKADLNDFDVPSTCAGGLDRLRDVQGRFADAVQALDDEAVFAPRPAHWGQMVPAVNLVTTMLTEHVHHIAEIGALRDVHRGSARLQPPPSPSSGPPWWLPS